MPAVMETADVVVVGGGIAGASAAYHLSSTHAVVLVEAEAQLAHHSTGRSAALYFENYGSEPVRPLTKASKPFFLDPSPGLADGPLASPRGALWLAGPDQTESLRRTKEEGLSIGTVVEDITPEEAAARVPVLRPDRLAGALWEPEPLDLDVAAIHQAFIRGFRANGGSILLGSPLTGVERHSTGWVVRAGSADIRTEVIVDAAGAWGDAVATLAGVEPVGLQPLRRTAFMVAGDAAWRDWPMVVDVDHRFYFKPDGSQLLCSPADETPSDPVDARPQPIDVARAIDDINQATTLDIRSVRSEWAGLRTFAPDRSMVIGPDPSHPGFVWLVGQGGTGIQTAPAAGALAAATVRREGLPEDLARAGVDPDRLAVGRLR